MYIKIERIEELVLAEHRKLHNLSEQNAKYRYIQLCRSLHTHGVTFFLVKVSPQPSPCTLDECLLYCLLQNSILNYLNSFSSFTPPPCTHTFPSPNALPPSFIHDTGEDAWPQQTCTSSTAYHTREHHENGREHQGGAQDLATHHRTTMGRFSKLIHAGKWVGSPCHHCLGYIIMT